MSPDPTTIRSQEGKTLFLNRHRQPNDKSSAVIRPSLNTRHKSLSLTYAVSAQLGNERRSPMRFRRVFTFIAVILLVGGLATAGDSPDAKREKTRKMAATTLNDLYKLEPTSKELVQKSAGYAVFNNMGTNLFLLSTARGGGIAVNSKTNEDTFMKMISAGAGLGVGIKDYRVVFAFETDEALARFLDSGWSGSAQADAAAKTSKAGGAYSGAAQIEPGVWVYQITKKGLALQLTLQGTKYYKDDDLNKK
jgi:lipid-binding SYLF domain-containing protein